MFKNFCCCNARSYGYTKHTAGALLCLARSHSGSGGVVTHGTLACCLSENP